MWICEAKVLLSAPASQWPSQDMHPGLALDFAGLRLKVVWFQERWKDHICQVSGDAEKTWLQKEARGRRTEKPRWNP